MQRRTHESPMDFEWQSEPPLCPTSPFTHLAQKQGQKSGFSFATPSKAPSIPDAEYSTFASASTPAPPFRNPSFTTPRRAFDADLFSETSGAESSPANNADAEDTPENSRTITTMTAFMGRNEKKPIFGKFGLDFKGSSPGRGDLRRPKYSDVVSHKVRKRKRLDREYQLQHGRRGSSDSDSDSVVRHQDRGQRSTSKQSPLTEQGWLASVLSFIDSKPNLPLTLTNYAQLIFNSFIVVLAMYVLWNIYLTFRSDIDKQIDVETAAVLAEMSQCAKDYANNRCTPGHRAPALETACQSWEACMNKDASAVGRAKVGIATFADILNGFVDHLSYRTMIFLSIFTLACIGVSNFAFSSFRSMLTHHQTSPPHYYVPTPAHDVQWGRITQTPRHPSGQEIYLQNGIGTPFHSLMPSETAVRAGSPRKGSWQ